LLGTIDTLTESLTNNFSRVNEIIEDSIVDSGQSTRSGTRLLTGVTTGRNSQDTTLSNKDNVRVRELLFEFAGKSSLNLLETSLSGNRDKNNDGLLTSTELNL
jgi:hypothetical protein